MREIIEENYLHPEVDLDEFSVQNSGRWWHYDWFERAKIQLEPSEHRFIVAPMWELPFRRSKNSVIWNPHSVEVSMRFFSMSP